MLSLLMGRDTDTQRLDSLEIDGCSGLVCDIKLRVGQPMQPNCCYARRIRRRVGETQDKQIVASLCEMNDCANVSSARATDLRCVR